MQLKVKFLKWSARRPIAILHRKLAVESSIHADDRIIIKRNSHKIIAVVDIASGMLNKNEIAVSAEVSQKLNLRENDTVIVSPASQPESIPMIIKKLECRRLNKSEINQIIKDITDDALTESEIAYFISAVYKCGMSLEETKSMIQSIVSNGKKLNLKNKLIADKHSIGGIPGRTTPIIVSICAAAGLTMPKTSSRAITTPSGTADALEVICKVEFSIPEIRKIIKKTNACIVWGGSLGLAPADDKIIQVEKLLNLDPESQLLASIMSKKIAVGSKYVLIEIPFGKYAKVNKKQALNLQSKFKTISKKFNIHLECLLFEAIQPFGNGIGPALEIKDVIKVLRRESPCFMLEQRALNSAGKLLEMTGKAKKGKGYNLAKEILDSGKAFEKFIQIIRAQKGRIAGIKEAKIKKDIFAEKNGSVREINIKLINSLAKTLGCPSDKLAGVYLYRQVGEKIKKGDKILTLYSESAPELKSGIDFYNKNKPIILR